MWTTGSPPITSERGEVASRNASWDWVANARCTASPENENRKVNRKTFVIHPAQDDPQVGEVDLGVRAGLVGLRDEHFLQRPARRRPDLRAAHPHVVPHRGVGDLGLAVLVDQPGMHPPGGVALLARRVEVRAQHLVDQRLGRVQPRCGPYRGLARRRRRAGQRLAHRAPVHPIPVGQPPDRELASVIAADRLEQLHLRRRHLALPARPPTQLRRRWRWGQLRPS
jgi:hypothetical protein